MPRIVGIGASAGGLSALELFFSQAPVDSGLAYVVVQHMDPQHKAMLSHLLQRVTPMPVQEAVDGMTIERNAVYVIPPNHELTVAHGLLRLGHLQPSRGKRLLVDVLFGSLAREQGDLAIGVVLSGMGADGTLGLQAIKSQQGLTLAQLPESAEFDSMPQHAIASGAVDIIAPPGDMPGLILSNDRHDQSPVPPPQSTPEHLDGSLLGILQLLREHSKHDLSSYKTSTLLRRIERRIAVHNLDSMAAYAQFLHNNPQELDLLFAEMLIGVTHFFRDPDVWQDLKDKVLPELMSRRQNTTGLRAWVVGCSTGEEAYSLAMAFKEVQDAQPEASAQSLQIFATDLSAEAIAVARKGQYAAKVLHDLSLDRLRRFFSPHEGGFLVNKDIRDMVLFAQHDVIIDPPFTRLDMLSCRNVLIYFNATLQRRLLPLFHYSVRPGGVLLLGGSETVGRAQALFTPLSAKSRLYLRSEAGLNANAIDFPVKRTASSPPHTQETHVSRPPLPPANLQSLADHVLLQAYSPPAVLVNPDGDILYISGRTGRYLEPAAGKANWNIHVMARVGIRTQLAVALRQALSSAVPVEVKGLNIEGDGSMSLHLTLQCIHDPKALEGMVMVVFREVPTPSRRSKTARQAGSGAESDVEAALASELEHCREEIQALRREQLSSKETLEATNDALQSANEELQSANEELTTSKEEAQSMNEELQTINGELQTKLDDLSLAQSDMQNLLNSTDIATLFLDDELNVRRFTEQATGIFQLREGDIGRPLSDLASKLTYPTLHQDAKDTLRTLSTCEKQIPTTDGRWLSIRIMPYRTLSNLIQGVVLTFVDITAAKALESQLRKG